MSNEENKSEREEILDPIENTDGNVNPGSEEVAADNPDMGAAIHSIAREIDNENSEADEPTTEEELADAKGQILKLHAELDNVRKRLRREADDQIRHASAPLIVDLLQVFDNLKRAIEAAGNTDGGNEAVSGLLEGVQMVSKQFEDTLGKFHCKPIPAMGELFDPNFHEAISQMPSDEVPNGHVIVEATQGFQLHDRILRPSQVVVSTGKPE